MPGALYQGPFFVSGIFVRPGTGRGTPDTRITKEHTCIIPYHSLWIPLLYPVIDTSVTPGAHLYICIP